MPDVSELVNSHLTSQETSDSLLDEEVKSFFLRNGFDENTREQCDKYAKRRFPKSYVKPSRPQGYCSYTLIVSNGCLLQFRPEAFKLDVGVCNEARIIYHKIAPATSYEGTVEGISLDLQDSAVTLLHVYLQETLPGIPLSEFRQSGRIETELFRKRLIEDLAGVFALGFHKRRSVKARNSRRTTRRGNVSESIPWRLDLLQGIPKKSLLRYVSEAKQQLDSVENSPWCLTHGDLLPGNIMIDPETGHITGVIDWAEAEWLPFGMALYGLEEVLGRQVPRQGFQYYEDHEKLRRDFWNRLLTLSRSGLDCGLRPWVEEADAARKLGILLWRGIAFDDGLINRVVEVGRDDSELQKLELFLEAPSPILELGKETMCETGFLGFLQRLFGWRRNRLVLGQRVFDTIPGIKSSVSSAD